MKIAVFASIALLAGSVPAAGQQVPLRATQLVFRLGGSDAPEPYAFSATPQLVVSEAGDIHARISNEGVIVVFDGAGKFIRRIGRRGMGPGEFQVALAHGLLGDTLWVVDWPTPRIARFGGAGLHISTTRTPFDFGQRFSSPSGLSGLLAGGRVYANPPSPVIGVQERIVLPLLVGDAVMQSPDTVALLPNPRGLFIPGIGTWSFDPVPMSPIVGIDPRGSSIAVVSWGNSADEMRVRLLAPTGELRWERRFPSRTTAIPASVRDSLIEVGVEKARPQVETASRRGVRFPGSVRDLVEQGLSLPRYYAPARRVLIGVDRSVWIEQSRGLSGGRWLILDPAGNPLFTVDAPHDFRLDDASQQWMWGTTIDDLGVAYLTKLRVIDSAPSRGQAAR